MTVLLEQAMQLFNEGAVEACLELLQDDPAAWSAVPEGQLLAGATLHRLEQLPAARRHYEQALALEPNLLGAAFNLALLDANDNRQQNAIELLQRVLEQAPFFVDARMLLADCYQQLGQIDLGLAEFDLLLQAQPREPYVREKFAQFLNSARLFARAALTAPDTVEGLIQSVYAYGSMGLNEQAYAILDQLEQMPDLDPSILGETAMQRGSALALTGNWREALPCLMAAWERGSRNASLAVSIAWCYGYGGQLDKAWPWFRRRRYERWHAACSAPEWQGEPLQGKTILVQTEQGAGDTLFAMRYLPLLQQQGGRVLFSTYPDILELLRQSEGSAEAIPDDIESLEPDYQVRMFDLPGLFNTTAEHMPAPVPYVTPDKKLVAEWGERLQHLRGFRVGVVWAGNPKFPNDVNRSSRLSDWLPLASVPGVDWICLQKGAGLEDAQPAPLGWNLHLFDDEIRTYGDSAALIANLDLVISVDTSAAHLAGAMGKPVWILVSALGRDFRWMDGREETPWYPSARVLAQPHGMSWAEMFRQVVLPRLARTVEQSALELDAWSHAACRLLAGQTVNVADHGQVPDACLDAANLMHAFGFAVECDTERLTLLGLLQQARQLPALDERERCLALVPEDSWPPEYFEYLAQACIDAGRLEEAVAVTARGLSFFPHHAELYFQQGRAHWRLKNGAEALAAFQEATRRNRRHQEAFNNLGFVLMRHAKDLKGAADAFQRAVELNPRDQRAWSNFAMLATDSRVFGLGEAIWQYLTPIMGGWVPLLNLGAIRYEQRRYTEAIEFFEAAEQLVPEEAAIHSSKAAAWRELGHEDKAIAAWEQALRFNPGDKLPWMGIAWLRMQAGNFAEGWPAYGRAMVDKNYPRPLWDGSPLNGRRLLVLQDQGYGDLFQFVTLMHRIEGDVTLATNHGAVSLMQEQGWPFPVIRIDDVNFDEYDVCVEMMRLAVIFQVDLAQPQPGFPYLYANPQRQEYWKQRLGGDRNLKVGFVWAGSAGYKADYSRSTHLSDWAAIQALEGVTFYSLQKDQASNQAGLYPDIPLVNIAVECESFAHTAAAMMELDLIISPDTGIAHLAGALGRPVWLLIPGYNTDYRWMLERSDCPWYPNTVLWRQRRDEPWSVVIGKILQHLVETCPGVQWRS